MIQLLEEQKEKINGFVRKYQKEYLETEKGREHIECYDKEKLEVRKIFEEIKNKYEQKQNIEYDVLYHLLPYLNTRTTREKGYRISTWPTITKDIKSWFEAAGWQKKENWSKVSETVFLLIYKIVKGEGPKQAISEFLQSEFSKGFQTGMISPILYCLNPKFLVINSKTVDTINFIVDNEIIDSRLENYLDNVEKIRTALDKLDNPLFTEKWENFDAFCHWMCSKRLGGYARVEIEEKEIEIPSEEKEVVEITNHEDAMGILLELGKLLGYSVYCAHPSRKYRGQKLGGIAGYNRIPEEFSTQKHIERVDVIWFSKHIDRPCYFFEVEDKGTMREALHRLYGMMRLNAKFFIISPIANSSKFEEWSNTEPFRSVKNKFQFKSFEDLKKFYEYARNYQEFEKAFLGM